MAFKPYMPLIDFLALKLYPHHTTPKVLVATGRNCGCFVGMLVSFRWLSFKISPLLGFEEGWKSDNGSSTPQRVLDMTGMLNLVNRPESYVEFSGHGKQSGKEEATHSFLLLWLIESFFCK